MLLVLTGSGPPTGVGQTPWFLSIFSLVIVLGEAMSFSRFSRIPCTAGFGVLDETDEHIDLDETGGCNFLKGEVPFVGGTCAKLLEQGPCQRGEWLVIDDDEDMLTCKWKECPDNHVKYDDECVSLDDRRRCKPTFELIINENGEGECECPPGHLHHPPTDRCYVPYTQGPCRPGFIIKMKVDDHSGIGECRRNPCPKEKMTPLDHWCLPREDTFFAKCYTIGKQHPCKAGSYLLIEPTLAMPFCLGQQPNSIVPRIVKRAAPCQLSYRNSCVRECEGPQTYRFMGFCASGYAYFWNSGQPICLRARCRKL